MKLITMVNGYIRLQIPYSHVELLGFTNDIYQHIHEMSRYRDDLWRWIGMTTEIPSDGTAAAESDNRKHTCNTPYGPTCWCEQDVSVSYCDDFNRNSQIVNWDFPMPKMPELKPGVQHWVSMICGGCRQFLGMRLTGSNAPTRLSVTCKCGHISVWDSQ